MSDKRAIDRAIARLAANQHGVVSVDQLRAIGLDLDAISYRVRVGWLYRVHRGVYAVGHPHLTVEGRWMAAVLACGQGAVLSHRSAAALWGMLPSQPGFPEVTVPGHGGRRRREGIRLHRSISLYPAHATLRLGIPVTTPARTLADLRRCATPDELREALRQAERRGYRSATGPVTNATSRAASSSGALCGCAAAIACPRPRSTCASATTWSTSCGASAR
jgi:predicted transcriptional regulator of viral defense system